MASVISLTEARIQELLAGWENVVVSQDDINELITQLRLLVLAMNADLEDFDQNVRPQLEEGLASNSISIDDILDNKIPGLDLRLTEARLTVNVLENETLPRIQTELESTRTLVLESPSVYTRPEPPENPDENDRDLVVGDVWYDSDNNNLQHIWNGAEWTTFGVDIPDFSLTVRKFQTSSHMIY